MELDGRTDVRTYGHVITKVFWMDRYQIFLGMGIPSGEAPLFMQKHSFFPNIFAKLHADHVSENALLYLLTSRETGSVSCRSALWDRFWGRILTQFPLKLPWSKRSVHLQSHITSKLTIQVTVQNINDDNPFVVSHKPTWLYSGTPPYNRSSYTIIWSLWPHYLHPNWKTISCYLFCKTR